MAELVSTDALGGMQVHLTDEDRNLLAVALKPTLKSSTESDALWTVVMGTGPRCRACRVAGLAVELEKDHCSECADHLDRPDRTTMCRRCTDRELDDPGDA